MGESPPPAKAEEKKGADKGGGKGGKNEKGEPVCFSWGRGRDGPCKDLGIGSECKNTPKRKHQCEFCGDPKHKSKDCPKKPKDCKW